MAASAKLLNFFLCEFDTEERAEFARLSRVPDCHVVAKLAYYRSLGTAEREAFRDCCAHWAYANYGFVVGAPKIDHTKHPYFERWRAAGHGVAPSIPLLRAAAQQYKIDASRGASSSVSEEEFRLASSVHPVKAPDLRKRVRVALKPLGYYRTDELGCCRCRDSDREFRVCIDYGGRTAQLRYSVAMAEFSGVHPLHQFRFERVLGFGLGDWNYIVEENVDDAMLLFTELVRYCVALPARMRNDAS